MRDRDGLHLDLRGYAGPLDLLLELVRAGRVDVGAISLLDLAVQFEAALEGAIGRGDVPLSRLGDWLVAAANLALLRSRLLLPEDSREGREARLEAEALRRQLADRAAVAALADWLGNRRQLGRQVFARGAPEHAQGEVSEGRGATPVADLTTLLRACLELMSRPERVPAYRPNPPDLWRPPAAVARMRRLLGEMADLGRDEALPLEHFLPSRAATPTPSSAVLRWLPLWSRASNSRVTRLSAWSNTNRSAKSASAAPSLHRPASHDSGADGLRSRDEAHDARDGRTCDQRRLFVIGSLAGYPGAAFGPVLQDAAVALSGAGRTDTCRRARAPPADVGGAD
ncbi:hypothetical protein ACE7GA_26645 (plasmid) [Roseomonas sp. CCTCC AB2023176]|uniref:hypothetical protein n=1 Tax=Roseomonas sp. CCTCC AB2023176 TaxID=3342640 RepID=UPI0035DC2CF9